MFEDVCDYFMRLEHFKVLDRNSFYPGQCSEEKWEFSYYSYDHLCAIFGGIKRNDRLTEAEREAYESELDLIEVCTGNPQTLQQIVLFPDVDVTELTRDWCFDYAHAKNFALFEFIEGNVGSGMVETCEHRLYSLGSVSKE
jgi:hypothetical protein